MMVFPRCNLCNIPTCFARERKLPTPWIYTHNPGKKPCKLIKLLDAMHSKAQRPYKMSLKSELAENYSYCNGVVRVSY